MKSKLYIFSCLLFLFFSFGLLRAEEKNSILFVFLIPSENINMSVQSVKMFDSSEKEIATFYPGDTSASSENCNFFEAPEGGRWGNITEIEGVKCRNINEKSSQLQYSFFLINLPEPVKDDMYFVVKYFDSAENDLIPVGFIKGSEFVRLGQIYRSGTNKWVEDIFEIPIKK